MASLRADSILRPLRRAMLRHDGAGLTDGQLLRSFLERRDEAAFEALVHRHGPMVHGVCRRVLGNVHDADDAFQAAFLVLIRKARSLATREVVGDFLHGVAYRTALKARTAEARRRLKERRAARREAIEDKTTPEWLTLLDREIAGLPEKYRVPVVLCDLQGHTRKEAARQLGWREGTVAGRLARARTLLARRLTRRGIALSAGALASVLTPEACGRLPLSLVQSTGKAATLFAAGQAASGISAPVAALTEGVVRAMLMSKIKTVAVLLASAFILTIGAGAWRYSVTAGQVEERQAAKSAPATDVVPVDKPMPPPMPVAGRTFQIDVRMTREIAGQLNLLAEPRLRTLDGREASFAVKEGLRFVPGASGNLEEVVMGPKMRVVVCSASGGQMTLDMTVSQPTRIVSGTETTVEAKSIRIIRQVELGQPVTTTLKTGAKDQTLLKVTAAVTEVTQNANSHSIESAERDLKMAEFYRRTGHAESACFYYEVIKRRYPDSVYAERARERLAELKKQPKKSTPNEQKEPARVGQIFIAGNEKTRQEVILERIQLYPGQVFSPVDLRAAERNLSQLKGFKQPPKVTVTELDGDGPYRDIKITVDEK